ncbi:ABC transporter substrate-binding protein [Candidatus Aerophobetes bacterium]|uniref:ABC transporter substrate-binding protein n=1 Tax=Aerophobetes bacterium TaxID=2030807 RepID=A0A2A4YHJ2_UNCAE|nr:MAG: ABC transporter substrate-binding protein [Candidatus Aerophobetes bacterium]
MLKKGAYLFLILFATMFVVACSRMPKKGSSSQNFVMPSDKLKVLSTTTIIDDLVAKIGKEHIVHTSLITGQLDPHSYELVKGDDDKISNADVLLYNGLGLEHGASLKYHLENAENAYAISDSIQDDTAFIFVDGQVDPHIWMDLSLLAKAAIPVGKILAKHDPLHEKEYMQNAKDLEGKMLALDRQMEVTLGRIPKESCYLVTSHDAFYYFTRRYLAKDNERASGEWKKRCRAPEGLAPDGQMSPKDIGAIVEYALSYGVEVVFTESNVNQDALKKVVKIIKQKGSLADLSEKPLYGDTMGEEGSGAEDYLKMMEYNSKLISEHLCKTHERSLL